MQFNYRPPIVDMFSGDPDKMKKAALGAALGATGPVGGVAQSVNTIDSSTGGELGNQLAQGARDAFVPEQFKMGSHTIDPSAFQNSDDFQQLYQGYTDKANAAAGRQGPQINMAPQDQFRQGQMGLATQLALQAMGQGPSMATLQMNQNTDDAMKSAMALAASGRSGTAGGRLKAATDQAAAIQSQGARDSAALRVQEQIQARQMLGNILGQGRGQDIGLATAQTDADLRQGAMNNQLGLGYDQMGLQAQQLGASDLQEFEKLKLQQFLMQQKIAQQANAATNLGKSGNVKAVTGLAGGIGSSLATGGYL